MYIYYPGEVGKHHFQDEAYKSYEGLARSPSPAKHVSRIQARHTFHFPVWDFTTQGWRQANAEHLNLVSGYLEQNECTCDPPRLA